MSQLTWDKFFLDLTQFVSTKSKDRSTKVGAIIVAPDHSVRAMGYNGFPRGVDDVPEDRHTRPDKYHWTEHAERNAIFNAHRNGASVVGCTLYMNYAPCPCSDCSRACIQAGITEIVTSSVPFPGVGNWGDSLKIAYQMLSEAGITVRQADYDPANQSGWLTARVSEQLQ